MCDDVVAHARRVLVRILEEAGRFHAEEARPIDCVVVDMGVFPVLIALWTVNDFVFTEKATNDSLAGRKPILGVLMNRFKVVLDTEESGDRIFIGISDSSMWRNVEVKAKVEFPVLKTCELEKLLFSELEIFGLKDDTQAFEILVMCKHTGLHEIARIRAWSGRREGWIYQLGDGSLLPESVLNYGFVKRSVISTIGEIKERMK